ncbi:MAG: DUF47 family protein [Kiritimatiellaeota bacterium]|nr:DUF47 family protein [Kiritimatiellota bacterium]
MFMWQKNKQVHADVERYLTVVDECLDCFCRALQHVVKHGHDTHFERLVDETHRKESDADTIRREIEFRLYEKSLLPDSREDLMLLLERLDSIPNTAEEIIRRISYQGLNIPDFLHGPLLEIARLGIETFELVKEAVNDALGTGDRTQELARRIDEAESVADRIEGDSTRAIFRSDLGTGKKILLAGLISGVSDLCDEEEDAAYFLRVFVIKRRI